MKTTIVRIGNSRGVRIPKALLEQCGLHGTVELAAEDGRLVITPVAQPRAGWEDAFRRMAEAGDDELLDADLPAGTSWDQAEWEW